MSHAGPHFCCLILTLIALNCDTLRGVSALMAWVLTVFMASRNYSHSRDWDND